MRAISDLEIETAFAKLVELKIDALLVIPDPSFQSRRDLFIRLAARYAVPTIYYSGEYVAAGGLVSYGASFTGRFAKPVITSGAFLEVLNQPTCRSGSRPSSRLRKYPLLQSQFGVKRT
jgi:putative ABC transport system substrate-binding protein